MNEPVFNIINKMMLEIRENDEYIVKTRIRELIT